MEAKAELSDGGRSSGRIQYVPSYKELLGIDGEGIELERNIFPGFSTLQIFRKSRMICEQETLNLKNSQTASSSCQCSTTRSIWSHGQVIQWTTSKVLVYSNSILCLGKTNESKDAIFRRESEVEEFKNVPFLQRIAGNRWRSN